MTLRFGIEEALTTWVEAEDVGFDGSTVIVELDRAVGMDDCGEAIAAVT